MFSVVVQLGAPIGAALPIALVELAGSMGFRLSAQFPGVDDETLQSFVLATSDVATDLDAAAVRFRAIDSVISAYPSPQPAMP